MFRNLRLSISKETIFYKLSFFFKVNFYKDLFTYCVYHILPPDNLQARRGHQKSLQLVVSYHAGFRELNPEQAVLLTTGSSLRSMYLNVKNIKCDVV